MTDIAIQVNNLSKQYHIGKKQKRYHTLRDSLSDVFVAPLHRASRLLRGQATRAAGLQDTIWALKDVSFEIKSGEVVGIIGRNGAGKSTLLKILSRITEPTQGSIDIYGRVGSLLEVGTGFHPELSGRENIYLNGAILGMSHHEIDERFDAIVNFAEVETFLDTPVKHYSSGMYLRLAFAVAAHLEPEILLVDEVLAVGDASFQKKCLGKMSEVAQTGRTVLFVSHNMSAIENLCSRAILLQNGQYIMDGSPVEVISAYLDEQQLASSQDLASAPRPKSDYTPIIRSINILNADGESASTIRSGDPVSFEIGYRSEDLNRNLMFSVLIETLTGGPILFFQTLTHHGPVEEWPSEGIVRCHVPSLPLLAGTYRITIECATGRRRSQLVDKVEHCAELNVAASDYFETGFLPKAGPHGYFLLKAEWKIPEVVAEPHS